MDINRVIEHVRGNVLMVTVPSALVSYVAALVTLAQGNFSAATAFAIVAYVGTYIAVEA